VIKSWICILLFSTVMIIVRTIMPRCHSKYNVVLCFCMASIYMTSLTRMVINAPAYHFELSLHCIEETRGNGSVFFLSNPTSEFRVDSLLLAMAPVVRIEPNGIQTLLSFDNARDDLERNDWRVFIEKFEGFNLRVAQEFSVDIRRLQRKNRSVQLEVIEDFLKLTP
jgi:hypothetical protein